MGPRAIASKRKIPGKRTSKSKKPKEQYEMMQTTTTTTTTTTTSWFDLPLGLQVEILRRVVAIEKLWTIPKVCRDWREICKEPSMWKAIYMDSYNFSDCRLVCVKQILIQQPIRCVRMLWIEARANWLISLW